MKLGGEGRDYVPLHVRRQAAEERRVAELRPLAASLGVTNDDLLAADRACGSYDTTSPEGLRLFRERLEGIRALRSLPVTETRGGT